MRLFVALAIPDSVAQGLLLLQGGVPGARWQAREQLHLTLRFIGEVDGSNARALDDALAAIDAPALDLQLHGAGQFGNTGRNMFVGPHYFELDASLLKRIPITERFKLELRADGTNISNSVSFNAPTVDITNSTFGRIRNSVASGSRKIQIGAKIHF